jgi:hypothetical protein
MYVQTFGSTLRRCRNDSVVWIMRWCWLHFVPCAVWGIIGNKPFSNAMVCGDERMDLAKDSSLLFLFCSIKLIFHNSSLRSKSSYVWSFLPSPCHLCSCKSVKWFVVRKDLKLLLQHRLRLHHINLIALAIHSSHNLQLHRDSFPSAASRAPKITTKRMLMLLLLSVLRQPSTMRPRSTGYDSSLQLSVSIKRSNISHNFR